MYNITLENQISLKNYLSSELAQLNRSIKSNEDLVSQPISEVEKTLKDCFCDEELIERLEELRKSYQHFSEVLSNQKFVAFWLEEQISKF
jgi:hypothetical protein